MAEKENPYEPSIVRIYGVNGSVQGAGFRISDRHLLTCAHVVVQALDIKQIAKQIPGGEITLDFPLVAAGVRMTAQVVRWQPDIPELSDIPVGERDIAVLELKSAAPNGSHSARLVVTNNYWGHTFRAGGFPRDHDDGVWASGFIRGKQANGWVQIEDYKEIGFFVEQGFSGTLVWDEQSDGVAGMIVGVEGSAKRRTAYMIPALTLARVSAGFAEQTIDSIAEQGLPPLEPPGATTDPKSPFYVSRRSDTDVLNIITRQGTTTTIKGPGQMGKSTLLVRMFQAAKEMGKEAVLINLQGDFDQHALKNVDTFFSQFCSWITVLLNMQDRVEHYWSPYLGNIQRVTRYVREYLLKEIASPLFIAMDEVDSIFSTDFRKDFFGMLRSWHEGRGSTPIWKQLDIALVTSSEPYHFIDDLNQSPFVGDTIEMMDFTAEEANDLNKLHGLPFSAGDMEKLLKLVVGHPYLIRSALYQVSSRQIEVHTLLENATADDGPFSQHLASHYFNLHDKEDLVKAMKEVIQNSTCQDERARIWLQGAGLVRIEGNAVKLRRPIYAEYFRRHLHV